MRHGLPFALLLFGAACGGGAASSPTPQQSAGTPEAAVRSFLQGVADSNITTMARYWGGPKGPAGVTGQPSDYQKRMEVTQLFLRTSPYKLLRTDPVRGDDLRRSIVVELSRTDNDGSRCTRTLSVGVVQAGNHGWIVEALDLNQAGTPGRSCTSAASSPSPGT